LEIKVDFIAMMPWTFQTARMTMSTRARASVLLNPTNGCNIISTSSNKGKYSLVARAAFPDDAPAGVNRHIRVSIDGQEVGTILLYAGGDYNDWQNSNAFITDVLTTGQHTLTLNFVEGYWRMRLIFAELADGTPSTDTPTNSNTPTSNSPSEGNVPTTGNNTPSTGNIPFASPTNPDTIQPNTNPSSGNVTPISDNTPTTQHKPGNSMASSVSISISFVLGFFVSIL
jgi:uncharacterized protein with GYD domain